jgi:hypothetical protein
MGLLETKRGVGLLGFSIKMRIAALASSYMKQVAMTPSLTFAAEAEAVKQSHAGHSGYLTVEPTTTYKKPKTINTVLATQKKNSSATAVTPDNTDTTTIAAPAITKTTTAKGSCSGKHHIFTIVLLTPRTRQEHKNQSLHLRCMQKSEPDSTPNKKEQQANKEQGGTGTPGTSNTQHQQRLRSP